MKVEQVYEIVNSLTKEYLGETAIVNEDLTNLVDIGSETISLQNLDKYVNSLIDHIGKVVFVNRPYSGSTPSLYMDGWEYGAIMEKIQYDELPDAEENETWELVDGQSYDPNVFTQPKVSAKFFSKKVTFDIPMSFASRQVKMAFDNATQLNSLFSMIETSISTSMTVKMDSLAMRALNYMIGVTLASKNSVRAVNLLSMYNTANSTTLTAEEAIRTPAFIRYATFILGLYEDRLARLSQLFNDGGKDRFTPRDRLNVIMLSEFAKAADSYLQSDVFHNEYTKLPKADHVPYWQGSGLSYDFSSTSSINVQVNLQSVDSSGNPTITKTTISQSGIIAVMCDRYACGVANLDRRVTSNWNGKGEFFNNWYKFDAGYFDDPDENFVVFYLGETTKPVTPPSQG